MKLVLWIRGTEMYIEYEQDKTAIVIYIKFCKHVLFLVWNPKLVSWLVVMESTGLKKEPVKAFKLLKREALGRFLDILT